MATLRVGSIPTLHLKTFEQLFWPMTWRKNSRKAQFRENLTKPFCFYLSRTCDSTGGTPSVISLALRLRDTLYSIVEKVNWTRIYRTLHSDKSFEKWTISMILILLRFAKKFSISRRSKHLEIKCFNHLFLINFNCRSFRMHQIFFC